MLIYSNMRKIFLKKREYFYKILFILLELESKKNILLEMNKSKNSFPNFIRINLSYNVICK